MSNENNNTPEEQRGSPKQPDPINKTMLRIVLAVAVLWCTYTMFMGWNDAMRQTNSKEHPQVQQTQELYTLAYGGESFYLQRLETEELFAERMERLIRVRSLDVDLYVDLLAEDLIVYTEREAECVKRLEAVVSLREFANGYDEIEYLQKQGIVISTWRHESFVRVQAALTVLLGDTQDRLSQLRGTSNDLEVFTEQVVVEEKSDG